MTATATVVLAALLLEDEHLLVARVGDDLAAHLHDHGVAIAELDALVGWLPGASLSSWLAMRAIDRETRKLDQLERGVALQPERELQPAAPESDGPNAEPIPRSEIRIPNRDPRRKNGAKAAVPNAASPPIVSNAPPQSLVQPLPPAINVRPAPGAPKPQQKAKPPLALAP